MTYEIRNLLREDLEELKKDPCNGETSWLTDDVMDLLVYSPFSVSIFYKDRLMLSGGVNPIWYNRAVNWTLFSSRAKENFRPVFRGIQAFLKWQPFKRVEFCIPIDSAIGKKRAIALGFKLECAHAKSFLPDGTDCALYSLVRED